MSDLSDLRTQLADARAMLRTIKDGYETTKAICEMQTPTSGKNADDRKRELTVALANDPRHQSALRQLRAAEARIDHVQAQIEAEEDARRDREWSIRARLADALGGTGHEDTAFEAVADRRVTTEARSRYVMPSASLDDLYPPR